MFIDMEKQNEEENFFTNNLIVLITIKNGILVSKTGIDWYQISKFIEWNDGSITKCILWTSIGQLCVVTALFLTNINNLVKMFSIISIILFFHVLERNSIQKNKWNKNNLLKKVNQFIFKFWMKDNCIFWTIMKKLIINTITKIKMTIIFNSIFSIIQIYLIFEHKSFYH